MLTITTMNGPLYGAADCGPDQRWDPNAQMPGLPPGQCVARCGSNQRWDPNASVMGLPPGQCVPAGSTPSPPLPKCTTPITAITAMCVGVDGLVTGPGSTPAAAPKVPFYKNWKFWAAVGGVAVVGGGASYAIVRSRRATHY